MQARLRIYCKGCNKTIMGKHIERYIGEVDVDTANLDHEIAQKVKAVILAHRQECSFYRSDRA